MKTREEFALELEKAFKAKVKTDTEKMMETFTFDENMNIAYIPLVLTTMAFEYTHKVLEECAIHRIETTKGLCRAARKVESDYWAFVRKDLNTQHIEAVRKETMRYMKELTMEFTILWYSVNNEFKRLYPDTPYDEMRTDAIIARMMIEALRDHQHRMNRIIRERMHDDSVVVENPFVTKLYSILDAFCGKCEIKNNEHMKRWLTAFRYNLNKIQFEVA